MINIDKLKKYIEEYKKDFKRVVEEENYKWEAVKFFQDNFDIESTDFPEMLIRSLSKCSNLLNRARYFPVGVLKEIATYNPEYTRNMFRNLYDESIPYLDRIETFKEASKIYYKFKENDKLKTFQDASSISVYLFLNNPDKYYIYMSRKFSTVAKALGVGNIPKVGSLERVSSYYDMVDEIWGYTKTNHDLIALNRSRIDGNCYSDPNNHILAEDLVWFIFRREKEKEEAVDDNGYWPSAEEYPVNLTKEDWERFLNEVEYPFHKGSMRVLKCYLDIGGTASSTKLAERYGGHPSTYTSSVMNMSRRALKFFDYQPCSEGDKVWYFPIAFLGKVGEDKEKGTFVYKIREELLDALLNMKLDEIEVSSEEEMDDMSSDLYSKNMILYGPPGTGKTYNSLYYAVGICDDIPVEEVKLKPLKEVERRFKQLQQEERIAFTTFHQSYGYEEFIEGIKPVIDDSEDYGGDVRYSIEDGIFKEFCDRAALTMISSDSAESYGLNKNPAVWKVSLEGTGDNITRAECLENDHIRIGWDIYGEVITEDTEFTNGGRIVLNSFINKMQVGDIVLSCYSASTIDAIGVVTGDYEWHPEYSVHKRLRDVHWLAKNIDYNILELNGNTSMTLSTVYKMKLTVADVFKILDEVGTYEGSSSKSDDKPYVFIIDEINRGNISKIFGELITLIEPSKRIGKAEELRVELPYSKKQFGVPDNVYILGTMNTADRSIALMDTALRRRFQFVEMMPDSEVLKDIIVEKDGEAIDIAEMLKIINLRIEYLYDREHTIGHAYFMPLVDNPSIDKLAEIFDTNIIPLLKEYFYEDYGKIQMILGDNKKSSDDLKFVKETKIITKDIFNGDTSELDLPEQIYSIQKEALYNIRSYKEISKDL